MGVRVRLLKGTYSTRNAEGRLVHYRPEDPPFVVPESVQRRNRDVLELVDEPTDITTRQPASKSAGPGERSPGAGHLDDATGRHAGRIDPPAGASDPGKKGLDDPNAPRSVRPDPAHESEEQAQARAEAHAGGSDPGKKGLDSPDSPRSVLTDDGPGDPRVSPPAAVVDRDTPNPASGAAQPAKASKPLQRRATARKPE